MSKLNYLLILTIFSLKCLNAQDYIEIRQAVNSSTSLIQAGKGITFWPGSGYTPNGNSLTASINPSLPSNTPSSPALFSGSNVDIENTQIDKELSLGTLPVRPTVNNLGQANMSVAFPIPEDPLGLFSALQLNYSASLQDGLWGKGWSLVGQQIITRVPASSFYDGNIDPVDMDASDRFSFNGQRLLLKNPNTTIYGVDGADYETEFASFQKITSHGQHLNGPDYFTVETKDNLTYYFGLNTNSKMANNGGYVYWMLDKVVDAYGNSILYDYEIKDDANGKQLVLHSLKYGCPLGQDCLYEIKFAYNHRANIPNYQKMAPSYLAYDIKMQYKYLVSSVKVYGKSSLFAEYGFNYSFNNCPLLNKIDTWDKEGRTYNPVLLEWYLQDNNATLEHKIQNQSGLDIMDNILTGDFNNDGYDDFVTFPKYDHNGKIKVYHNNRDGYHPNFIFSTQLDWWASDLEQTLVAVDVDNDGFTDLVLVRFECSMFDEHDECVEKKGGIKIFRNTGGNGFDYMNAIEIDIWDQIDISSQGLLNFINFNGDRFLDIVYFEEGSTELHFQPIIEDPNNQDRLIFSTSKTSVSLNNPVQQVFPARFNNDERTDFLVFQGNIARALWLKETTQGNYTTVSYSKINNSFDTYNYKVQTGDFDGDGYTDFVTVKNDGSQGDVYYFTGDDFEKDSEFATVWPFPTGFASGVEVLKLYVDNFTGDPFSDIILLSNSNAYDLRYHQFLFNATGNYKYELDPSTISAWTDELAQSNHGLGITGYFRGDDKKTFLNLLNTSSNDFTVRFKSISPRTIAHHLHKVRDGHGVLTKFSYTRMNFPGSVFLYDEDPSEPYGVKRVVSGAPIVEWLRQYVNGEEVFHENYIYDGFKALIGKNSLYGLSKFYRRNITKNIGTKDSYTILSASGINNPNFTNLLKERELYLLNPGVGVNQKISTATMSYELDGHPSALGCTVIKLTERSSFDFVKNITSFTQFKYDNYLNLKEKSFSLDDGFYTRKEEFLNFQNAGAWYPSKPEIVKLTETRDGEVPFTTETYFQYNNEGSVAQQTVNHQGSQELDKSFSYNAQGKLITTMTIGGAIVRSTSASYSAEGFLESRIDENGFTNFYTFDSRTGYLLSIIDKREQETTFETKGFGWYTKESLPEGLSIINEKSFDNDQDGPSGSLWKEEMRNDYDDNDSRRYVNTLGQTLREDRASFGGQKVFTDFVYYDNGLIEKESEPYFSGSAITWNLYNYDDHDRITSLQNFQGLSFTTSYGELETTVTNDQTAQYKKTINSPDGLIKEVLDNGHSINYSYFSHGNLRETTGGANKVTAQYNDLLLQTSLVDRDAGNIGYHYNAFGDLLEQNDNGKTFTLSYDVAGRLESKEINASDDNRSYNLSYDQGGAGATGKLTYHEVEHDGGILVTSEHTYDKYGRENVYKETIDNEEYIYQYTYYKDGSVKTMTYPSGFTIEYEYDDNGFLKRIRREDNNIVIWEVLNVDAYGRVITQTYGNGLITEKTFDTYNFPDVIETKLDNTIIQKETYQFDVNTGNLISRTNYHGLTESFSYDILDQLSEITLSGNGSGSQEVSYDPNTAGQISSKDGIGDYIYPSNGSNRLSLVKPPDPNDISSSDIPTLTQSVNYTAFNKVKNISEGAFRADFSYGPDEQRRVMKVLEDEEEFFTRIYAGGAYEIENHRDNGLRKIHYIFGGDGLVAVYITDEEENASLYYVHQDYQGSVTHLTNTQGQLVEEYSFDAWGRRREPQTGAYLATPTTGRILDRGYTSHEHLPDEFNVINMNGRIYDPLVGMMMSPDNYVQDNTRAVNYNRYAYAFNNPLKYTDPSGEIVFTAMALLIPGGQAFLPIAIQTDIGWITGGINSKANGGTFMEGALMGAAIGAVNGALSMISPIKIPIGEGGFGLSIAPQLAVGTDGLGIGTNATLGYDLGNGFTAGVNFGGSYYASAAGTGASGWEGRIGYGIGYEGENFQTGIGSTYFFSGETSQQTGQIYAGGGKWKLTYENDTWAPVPGLIACGCGSDEDKYRTAGLQLDITSGKLKGAKAGFKLFTGSSDGRVDPNQGPNGTFIEQGNRYRMGALYVGYGNYRLGYNSERNVRAPIQNGFHNLMNYPHFGILDRTDRIYGGYYSSNPYTLW